MTVVDYYHLTGNPPNTTLMLDVDREAFVDLLAQRLAFTPDIDAAPLFPAGRGAFRLYPAY